MATVTVRQLERIVEAAAAALVAAGFKPERTRASNALLTVGGLALLLPDSEVAQWWRKAGRKDFLRFRMAWQAREDSNGSG